MIDVPEVKQARCFLVYGLAPLGVTASQANQAINEYMQDPKRGLAIFHDHFLGRDSLGGMVLFFVETDLQREALRDPGQLLGWQVQVHPLIFAHNPGALDAQIAYTLKNYRGQDWDVLRLQDRPNYGNAAQEAEKGEES